MSDLLSPQNSPVSAGGRPGSDVKRLNKRPLMFAAGMGAMVIGVIVYTYHERVVSTEQHQQAATTGAPVGVTKQPDVLLNSQSAGLIAPAETAYGSPKDGTATTLSTTQLQGGAGLNPALAAQESATAAAWTQYAQAEQAIQQQRLADQESAYQAPPSVDLSSSSSTGNRIAPLSINPGPPGAAPADLQEPANQLASGAAGSSGQTQIPTLPEVGGTGLGLFGLQGAALPAPNPAANDQDNKAAFLQQPGSSAGTDYLDARETTPISPYEIKAGVVIPATMQSGINSDTPGQVTARVRETVYDSATGHTPLIPQGAQLIGVYNSTVSYGQSRVEVAWQRIIFPNGNSFDLGTMPGADAAGYSGFHDEVNNHYLRVFGSALLLSAFSAGAQLSQPQNSNGTVSSTQVLAAAVGQEANNVGAQVISRGLDIQPTLIIRNGYIFNVEVTKDLVLIPWNGAAALPYGAPGRND